MNWVDLVMLAVIALSALGGGLRGFAREMLELGAWIVAALLASRFYAQLLPLARGWIDDPLIADVAAFAVVFIVILAVLSVLASLLSRVVRLSLLGGIDRLLGAGFGLVRGCVLLILSYIVLAFAVPPSGWPDAVRAARGLPLIDTGARYALARTPARWRPILPPIGPDGTAASGQESF